MKLTAPPNIVEAVARHDGYTLYREGLPEKEGRYSVVLGGHLMGSRVALYWDPDFQVFHCGPDKVKSPVLASALRDTWKKGMIIAWKQEGGAKKW